MKNNLQEVISVESVKVPGDAQPDIARSYGPRIHSSERITSHTIKAICSDSRRVVPGSAFFAIPGSRTNGELHLKEALDRGAKVVVSESPDLDLPHGVTNITVDNARRSLARFSKKFYDSPDESMSLVGIIEPMEKQQ